MTNATTIYLIGGTSDANAAARRLEAEGYQVVVSVATETGSRLAEGLKTEAGLKDAETIAARAGELGAAAVVDCSHPFALVVSREAARAAQLAGVPCLRYQRPGVETAGAVVVDSWEAAVNHLMDRADRALLTIGTRHLAPFAEAGIDFVARLLPVPESVNECTRLGLGPREIMAVCPPFSVEFNRACIRHAGANVLVTKESGPEGGLPEKLEAAAAEGIDVLVVSRPPEAGGVKAFSTIDELVAGLKEALEDGR